MLSPFHCISLRSSLFIWRCVSAKSATRNLRHVWESVKRWCVACSIRSTPRRRNGFSPLFLNWASGSSSALRMPLKGAPCTKTGLQMPVQEDGAPPERRRPSCARMASWSVHYKSGRGTQSLPRTATGRKRRTLPIGETGRPGGRPRTRGAAPPNSPKDLKRRKTKLRERNL